MKVGRSSISHSCANWNKGNCLGVIYKVNHNIKTGKHTLTQIISEDMANKPCLLTRNKECSYWDAYVVPSLNGH